MSPPEPSPSELFTQALALGIDDKPGLFLGHRGVIAFRVAGDRDFSVRLGREDAPLAWGADEGATLTLALSRAGLGRLLSGGYDPKAELSSGALEIEGEVELLTPLVQLLTQGSSALALRAGA